MSKSNRAKFNSHKSHVLFKTPRGNLYEISSQHNHRATARLSHLRHNNSLRDRRNFFRRLGRFDNIFSLRRRFSSPSIFIKLATFSETTGIVRGINEETWIRKRVKHFHSIRLCPRKSFFYHHHRASLIFFRRQYLPLRSLINGAALLVDTVNKPTRYAINFAHSCTRLCVANILCLLFLRPRKKRRRVDPTVYARYQR